ncbi:protein phosphatase 2C 70-like isoform X1 [Zingiber officinale]|uniref:protein phosphatase 2C 70-like isoform X1 n=1 Tax=Zingiber officinale TaxID=94328 RepID=UPI001C4B62D7|nr:protein phosphatase 2C 70-like isoform X1 [Zingiber officinale]
MRPFQSAFLAPSPSFSGADEESMQSLTLFATTTTNATTSSEMHSSLKGVFVVMIILLLLLLLIFLLACRPWRFFLAASSSSSVKISYFKGWFFWLKKFGIWVQKLVHWAKTDNLERPLLYENVDHHLGESYDMPGSFPEASRIQIDGDMASTKVHGFVRGSQFQPIDTYQADSLSLDISDEVLQDFQQIGSTLRHSVIPSCSLDERNLIQGDFSYDTEKHRSLVSAFTNPKILRSSLTLEVIAGPSCGLCCSKESVDSSMLPLTLGRVSPNDLLLKDSEVSGKHAYISWNSKSLRWELVDKGSLNGTFLNSQAIHHSNSGSRNFSDPIELADGDVITLGTSSKIAVKISQFVEHHKPDGVGIARDPMFARRGGKKLPMEDMCCCHCPLNGVEQFGLFGIFDGHGGAGAAITASQMLPENLASILSNHKRSAKVLSLCDASDILQDAFTWTEAAMNHQYEGCTATVLLIWFDHNKELFAQCANVGDSACLICADGELIPMTEDHRVTSPSERARFFNAGKPLKDGESRLCGLNICRMLGDKFLKEQDDRFSSKPHISQVVPIRKTSTAFALMGSDGLWDVITMKKAARFVLQEKQEVNKDQISADVIANNVLNEARTLRTEDNTTVIYLDFDVLRTGSCTIEV